jgi:hypothetical protein
VIGITRVAMLSCVAALVMACSEGPPTTTAAAKDGDRTAWEEQLRARTQTQNEYVRIGN